MGCATAEAILVMGSEERTGWWRFRMAGWNCRSSRWGYIQATRHGKRLPRLSSTLPAMRERINWSIGVWSLFLLLDFAIVLAIGVALNDRQLILALALLIALTLAFWRATRLTIEVRGKVLHVGRARIESRYVAEIIKLDKQQMRHERGPGLDPRAFLALRFWVKTGAKLILSDKRDPTPYWLFSTRRAAEIERSRGSN